MFRLSAFISPGPFNKKYWLELKGICLTWREPFSVGASQELRPGEHRWLQVVGAGGSLAIWASGHFLPPGSTSGQARGSPWPGWLLRHLTHSGPGAPSAAFQFQQGAILTTRHLRKVIIAHLISNRHHNEGLSLCGINFKTSGFDVSGKETSVGLTLLPSPASGHRRRRVS